MPSAGAGAYRVQVQEQPRRRGVDGQEVHQLSVELPRPEEGQVGEPPQQGQHPGKDHLPGTHGRLQPVHGRLRQERPAHTPQQHQTPLPMAAPALHQVCHVGLLQRLHPDGHVRPSPVAGEQGSHLPMLLGPALPSARRGLPQRGTTPRRPLASGRDQAAERQGALPREGSPIASGNNVCCVYSHKYRLQRKRSQPLTTRTCMTRKGRASSGAAIATATCAYERAPHAGRTGTPKSNTVDSEQAGLGAGKDFNFLMGGGEGSHFYTFMLFLRVLLPAARRRHNSRDNTRLTLCLAVNVFPVKFHVCSCVLFCMQ